MDATHPYRGRRAWVQMHPPDSHLVGRPALALDTHHWHYKPPADHHRAVDPYQNLCPTTNAPLAAHRYAHSHDTCPSHRRDQPAYRRGATASHVSPLPAHLTSRYHEY